MSEKKFYLDSSFEAKSINKKTNTIKIAGYANTISRDRAGDIITAQAWAKGVDNFRRNPVLLYQHKHDCPIGRVNKIQVDKKGIFVEANVSEAAEKNHGIHTLIKDGALKSFSVGFKVKDGKYNRDSDSMLITDVELLEISVVSVPCNQDSLFSISKSFENDEDREKFLSQFEEKEVLQEDDSEIEKLVVELDEEDMLSSDPNESIPFINLLSENTEAVKNGYFVELNNKTYKVVKVATDQSPTFKFLEIDADGNSCDNTLDIDVQNIKNLIQSEDEQSEEILNSELHNNSDKEKIKMANQEVDTPIDLTGASIEAAEKIKEADTQKSVEKAAEEVKATVKVSEPRVAELVEKTGEAIMKESDAKEKSDYTPRESEELGELKAQIEKYREEVASLTRSKMVYQENKRSQSQFSEKDYANAYLLAKCLNKHDPFDTKLGSRMKAVTSVDQFLSNFSSNIYTEMEQQLIIAPMFNRLAVDAKNFRVPVADEDTDGDVAQFKSGTFATGIGDTSNVPVSNQNTISAVTFTPHKFMATTHLAKDEEEDTVLPLLDFLRAAATRRLARAIDKSILRGTGALSGFTAQPTNAISAGTGYASVIEGLTNLTADASLEVSTGSASDKADPSDIASARSTLGKYGLQLGDQLVYLTTIEGYNNLVQTSDFRTVDKFGPNATYLTGSVGAVYGIPIQITEFLDNVGATGNHVGMLLYKPGFMIAERRGIEIESEYEPRQQVTAMYLSTRIDFRALTTNSDAALDSSKYSYACTVLAG